MTIKRYFWKNAKNSIDVEILQWFEDGALAHHAWPIVEDQPKPFFIPLSEIEVVWS